MLVISREHKQIEVFSEIYEESAYDFYSETCCGQTYACPLVLQRLDMTLAYLTALLLLLECEFYSY